MKTIRVNLYQFDELSDKAKEKARDWFRTNYPEYEWWDSIYDDAREAFSYFGLADIDIEFSGFWSQGDGASFTGIFRASNIKQASDLASDFPTDETLASLHARLTAIKHPGDARVKITRRGRYSHSYTMNLDDAYEYQQEDETELLSIFRALANWIYRRLESEYYYLMSDECVDEAIVSNGYYFTADGKHDSWDDE